MKMEQLLRSRKGLVILGGLSTLALAPVVAVVSMGSDGALSNSTPAKSLFALLSARSPGERTAAELTKAKLARKVALPRQRALPKVQPARPEDEFGQLLLMPEEPFAPELAALPSTPFPFGSPGGGIFSPPGGGGGGSCCGGGGGGGGGDDEPPPPNVPAVPEPATWAMLMLGVFGCGSLLRRRPRGGLAASH